MPEYFFHIRLDVVARHSQEKVDGKKAVTKVFTSPPQVAGGLSERELRDDTSPAGKRIAEDWRAGNIVIQSIDMVPSLTSGHREPAAQQDGSSTQASASASEPASLNKRFTGSGIFSTKARYESSDIHDSEIGWGVVRLFRDRNETHGLGDTHHSGRSSRAHAPLQHSGASSSHVPPSSPIKEDDCTTLCIPAVPSYFNVTRFLSWVGDKTREEVTHFRMLQTEESGKYMVLMRFRSGKQATQWRKLWNGRYFDDASPEMAQVVFIKSIELMSDEDAAANVSDPNTSKGRPASSTTQTLTPLPAALSSKPPAPPTPPLMEMPTCPVCLERMDESTGLVTILCQHIFHCSCLYKWDGIGCPVCRFTHSGLSGRRSQTGADDNSTPKPNECYVCGNNDTPWICLICGNLGCGRYDKRHAFQHWEETGHVYAMNMNDQLIWNYEFDKWVHRIVQNKLDGKTSEVPDEANSGADTVNNKKSSREKSIAVIQEYEALLTSQLESQRAYFEDKVSRAADKAREASEEAEKAASKAKAELLELQEAHTLLVEQTIPGLEKELDRANKRAEKAQEMAQKFEKELREEKTISEGLHERINNEEGQRNKEIADMKLELSEAKKLIAEQTEMVHDLQAFISGQKQLKEMGEEAEGGTVSLPEEQQQKKKPANKRRKGKGKNKAKEGLGPPPKLAEKEEPDTEPEAEEEEPESEPKEAGKETVGK